MRKKLLASFRGMMAVLLMLFATNIAPVATALVPQVGATSSTLTWGQQGRELASPTCLPGQTTSFHFVLSGRGADVTNAGTLNVSFSKSSSKSVVGTVHGSGKGSGSYIISGAYNDSASSATVTGAVWTTGTNSNSEPQIELSESSCVGTPTPSTTPVTAVLPAMVDLTCNASGSYTIPNTLGVVYQVGGQAVTGTHSVSMAGTVTVTAVAASSQYTLSGTTSFSLVFHTPNNCTTPVTAAELKVVVMPCVEHEDGEMDDESISQQQMNGEVQVTVTNPNNKNAMFTLWLDGAQKMNVNVAANSYETVSLHNVSVGNHVVTLKDKDYVVATEYFKVNMCEKRHEHGLVAPTVVAKAQACSTASGATGMVTVMVTNNSHGNRKFTVTLAGKFTLTTERIMKGETTTVTFTNVPAGTHSVVVSAKPSKFLTTTTSVTVATCATTVVPPVTPPTTTVPVGGRGGGQVLGAVTTAKVTTTTVGTGRVLGVTTVGGFGASEQLANTGDDSIVNIIVGLTVIAMALGLTAVSRKQQS
jgi:hypothetical protein